VLSIGSVRQIDRSFAVLSAEDISVSLSECSTDTCGLVLDQTMTNVVKLTSKLNWCGYRCQATAGQLVTHIDWWRWRKTSSEFNVRKAERRL